MCIRDRREAAQKQALQHEHTLKWAVRSRSRRGCLTDGFGELLGSTPHGPVAGWQIHRGEVGQVRDGAEHRIACCGQLEDLDAGNGAADQRG